MRSRLLFLALLALAWPQAPLSAQTLTADDPVSVEGGQITGVQLADSPVRAYLGIAFATPPVGELRWRPPQPVESWGGVRAADAYADACVQNLARSRLPWTEAFMHQGEASEDCLYLNVWTAAERADERRPVMVYIHGGGNVEGSSAIGTYDGEAFAQKGVVLVTVNYRLGTLGFLAHPELTAESEQGASGNYGILDQIAALEWVRSNVAAFGGDPDNVTIFGQSAGARNVAVLMASPLAEGLFARAIRHSGAVRHAPYGTDTPLAEAERAGIEIQNELGASSLAELRRIEAERLLEASYRGAVADGWVFSKDRDTDGDVPVMIGLTANDNFSGPDDLEGNSYRAEMREQYGEMADEYLSLYPAREASAIRSVVLKARRDRGRVSVNVWASGYDGGPVYTYYFDRAIPWPEHPEFGAFHTSDIPYVFGTLDALDRPWEDADHQLSGLMSSYWVNFATSGDPNGSGLPEWHRVDAAPNWTMRLGEDTGMMPVAGTDEMAFWTSYFKQEAAQ